MRDDCTDTIFRQRALAENLRTNVSIDDVERLLSRAEYCPCGAVTSEYLASLQK